MIVTKEKLINNLQNESRIKEEQFLLKINELNEQLEEKNAQQRDFNQKYERLEKELIDMVRNHFENFIIYRHLKITLVQFTTNQIKNCVGEIIWIENFQSTNTMINI